MSYSKTHDNFFAVFCNLSPQAKALVAVLITHMNQDNIVKTIQHENSQKHQTIIKSIMEITGTDKSRASKLIKMLTECGIVVATSKFQITLSGALIRKNRCLLKGPAYKIPEHIMEMRAKAALHFEKPDIRKSEDYDMLRALQKELHEERVKSEQERKNAERRHEQVMKALDFLLQRANGDDANEAKTFLTLIEGGKK